MFHGQTRVIIYINFVNLESLIVYALFQKLLVPKKKSVEVFAIYGHGGHLGHVTENIFYEFMSLFPKEASHKR